jgi:hypothetical protein
MNYSDLQTIEGLQFMPVTAKKLPIIKGWQTLFKKHNLENSEGVGLVCGKLSGNVECVDIDSKYDLTGKLFERYKRLIHSIDETLLEKLVVQETQSGGYHFIYRCEKIEGNLKLASRSTTEEERKYTYDLEIQKGATEEEAQKRAKNDKVRVLLETRGEGGYIMCAPSKGYKIIHRDYYGIEEITIEQREILHNIARQFNEVSVEARPVRFENRQKIKGLSVFDDYNSRGDVISLLEQNGWKIIGNKGQKTVFLRPGQTTSQSSGNYDHARKWFSVFTTSTEFQPQHAYLPYAVYAVLECNNDFSEASKKLYELGYGERKEFEREINAKTPSVVSVVDDDYSFLAKPEDYNNYLKLAREGNLPMGLSTGMPTVDKHFLFKHGNMVMVNGVDNVGKTKFILFLAFMSAIMHKWSWIIYAGENSIGTIMRSLIEFYFGKRLQKLNDIEYKVALDFVENHFALIKSDEDLYNYKDIINMAKKLNKKKKFDSVLIDPYNSLKIDLANNNKLNTHEYHYEAISEIKLYGKKNDIGFWVNNHAITGALRNRDAEGFSKPPGKEDTEGGGKAANKTDEFLTIHRNTQHPTQWMITELHVSKVKETETGGCVTPKQQPIRLRMNISGCGFSEVDENNNVTFDPILHWHKKQSNIPHPEISFEPDIWENNGEEDLQFEPPF